MKDNNQLTFLTTNPKPKEEKRSPLRKDLKFGIDESTHSIAPMESGEVLVYITMTNDKLEHREGIIQSINRDSIGITSVILSNGITVYPKEFSGTKSKEFVNEIKEE